MKITYKRDLSHSYMVASGRGKAEAYEEKMLANNEIAVFLPYHTTELDGEVQYWYDITGKRSLRDYLTQEKVTKEHLRAVLEALGNACCQLEEYLIAQERVLFSADGIFVEHSGEGCEVSLCYCPLKERDMRREFQSVTEHLIAEVDHADEELRKICYDLYEESLREEFSITVAAERLQEVRPEPVVVTEVEERCIQIRQQAYEEEAVEDWEPEEEEELTLWERLLERVTDWKNQLLGGVVSKRKELFPLPKEEEDFVFDAATMCEPKTQMLSEVVVQKVTKLVCEGNGSGPEILLDGDTITVGSKVGDNTVALPSPAVSRYHARIRKNSEGNYQLEDLNSTNGTYCNGQLLSYHEPHVLQRMDQILFADVAYRAV